MLHRVLALAALVRVSLAFSDTFPVVAWSGRSSNALSSVPSSFAPSADLADVLGQLLTDDIACTHDAVVLVDQGGLHASHLRSISSTSPLAKRLEDAPSVIQIPYVRRSSDLDISALAASTGSRCNARVTQYAPVTTQPQLEPSEKHVVCMKMPELDAEEGTHADAIVDLERMLSAELEGITSLFPNHLIVLTGSGSHISARQLLEEPASTSAKNDTLPAGGILKRYQLLTSELIAALLLVFFVLVPAVFAGISALSSIQSPANMAAPKSFNADTKKNQ